MRNKKLLLLLALGLLVMIAPPAAAQEDGQSAVASGKLMLTPDDNPVLLYADDTVMQLLVCSTPDCQKREIVTLGNVGGTAAVDATMVLDANGYPIISYYYAVANALGMIVCDDLSYRDPYLPTVAWYEKETVFQIARHISLAQTSAGNPVLIYYEDLTSSLKLAVCDDPTCASASTVIVVEGALQYGKLGQRTSLVLDADDAPSSLTSAR